MGTIKTWFNQKFIPQASRLGSQRHLATIRDAFAIFTPIIIAGALAVLWRSAIFVPGGGKGTLTGIWTAFNTYKVSGIHYTNYLTVMNHWMLYIQVGTINVMSLYVAFGIGYFLSLTRKHDTPVIAGLVSLAAFLAMTNMMITGGTWEGGMYWLSARGLITAILGGLLFTELFCWLSKNDKMAIKMPDGVPPAVSKAFAKLFPAVLVIFAAGLANLLVWMPFFFLHKTLSEGRNALYTFTPTGTLTAAQLKALAAAGVPITNFIGTSIPKGVDAKNFDTWINSQTIPTLNNLISQGKFKWDPTTSFGVQAGANNTLAHLLKLFSASQYVKTMVNIPVTGGDITMNVAIYCGMVAPLVSAAGSTSGAFGFALLYVFLVSFFWFFGIHGTNVVNGAFNPLWLILYAANVNGAENVFVQGTFDAYVFIGGWGATLALILATFIFAKKGSAEKQIAKFALAPGIFQINEPVTFGYPLVLNVFLIIPLFLVMPLLVITTWMGIKWFGVPYVRVLIPWTMPVGLGGLMASASAKGFVLAFVNLAIAFVVWTPFVLIMKSKNNMQAVKAAENTIEGKKVVAKKAKAKA